LRLILRNFFETLQSPVRSLDKQSLESLKSTKTIISIVLLMIILLKKKIIRQLQRLFPIEICKIRQVDRDKKIFLNNSPVQSFRISQIYTKIKTTMIIMMKEFIKNTQNINK
jgi:hypothetical protein